MKQSSQCQVFFESGKTCPPHSVKRYIVARHFLCNIATIVFMHRELENRPQHTTMYKCEDDGGRHFNNRRHLITPVVKFSPM